MAQATAAEVTRLTKVYTAALRQVNRITARPANYTAQQLQDARIELRSATAALNYAVRSTSRKSDSAAVEMVRATPSMRATPLYSHLAPPGEQRTPRPRKATPTRLQRRG